jgi:Fe-S cluster assembly protein SufD
MSVAIEIPVPASNRIEALGPEALEGRIQGDPEWLRSRREEALGFFETVPMPTRAEEEWRYTDLRRKLKLDALRLSDAPSRALVATAATSHSPFGFIHDDWPEALRTTLTSEREASGHVVEIDGVVVHVDLDPALAAQGVVLASMRAAVRDHAELLETHLGTEAVPSSGGRFPALNAAFWTDGVLLHVPKGVELDLPIRVTRWVSEAGAASFSRTLIISEAASRASLVEEVLSEDFSEQTFVSSVVEVFARQGAQIQYVSLQRLGRGAFYVSNQRTLAGRDSTLDTLNVNLGATTARVDLNAALMGPGANSDMLGLCFGDAEQHFDHNTSQDHIAPHAKSDLLYKGALDGNARAVFRGVIRVHPDAQRTDAYQTNRNLLLSNGARADSLPNLEIEADDVRCSHGSSVGALDEEQLFYLMGRGLTRIQAERLVVMGFLGDVLLKLPLEGVVAKVTEAIEEKLARHV